MASIVALLASLPEPIVQALSDELQGALRESAVDNPLGYLRNLIERHKAGTLTLVYAPLIQAEREQRQGHGPDAPRTPPSPLSPGENPHTRKPSMPPNWRAGLNIPQADRNVKLD